MGAFFNSGQVCVATKRIYIAEEIYKPFVEALVAVTATLKVGSPDEQVMLGPIQNDMQYQRVKGFFGDAKSKGYKFAAGTADVLESKGYFIQPAIIDNPPNDSRIIVEEPFGPIVPCQPFTDLAEVIARANDTTMGLGASVFSSDVDKAREVADQIESGMVFINSGARPSAKGAFGGVKESGIGSEFGSNGIFAFANIKAIHTFK